MPINDFTCTACGYLLKDKLHSLSDAPTKCPNCNKETLERVLSTASFKFCGTGFYQTDYKTK